MHTYKVTQIPNAIVSVKADSDKLQNKVHAIACSILGAWARKEIKVDQVAEWLTDLQTNTPWHGKSLADWVGVKTKLQWSKEKECWYGQVGQKYSKEELDSAKKEPFWKVSPPPAPKPLTDEMILKVLEGILSKQAKHDKKAVKDDAYSKKGNEGIRMAIEALKG